MIFFKTSVLYFIVERMFIAMSFYNALTGIFAAVRREAHLRFHIMIAVLISIFAYFYGLSSVEWAVLILMICSVISAELFNTAIEQAVDTATMEIKESAKLSKDAAAGAVLALSVCSVFVGFMLFGDFKRISDTLKFIFKTAEILIPTVIAGAALLIFLIYGGKNGK